MRIAAIDLGSNSFHLLVVDGCPDGTFTPLVREKEMLRLGDDVARDGRISRDAAERAIETLRRFRALAENAGATRVMACATSAFREARNAARLVDAIEAETRIRVRVIDGQEEAELIFRAIRASVLVDRGPALALDLGGGSLEVMVGDAAGLSWAASLPLGIARLSTELVRNDPPSGGDRRRLRERLEALLGPVAEEVIGGGGTPGPVLAGGTPGPVLVGGTPGPALTVGSGGTFCDFARMLAYRRAGESPASVNQFRFTRHDFLALHEELLRSSAAERRRIPGLESRRADIVPAGSMLLVSAMELFGFDEFTVSEWGLREGMVLDAMVRSGAGADGPGVGNIRRASTVGLARRCNWDEPHARHVARLAGELFGATRRLHRLGPAERELLEHAALLHDIGEHVSVLAHHKHTSYLIQHGGLRGFSPEEVDALAALARYGSRGVPKTAHKPFGSLETKTQERVVKLAALLRVATALDRGRAQTVEGLEVEQEGTRVRLRVRTAGNGELEVWAARRQARLFERVFGRRLEVAVARPSKRPVEAAQGEPVAAGTG